MAKRRRNLKARPEHVKKKRPLCGRLRHFHCGFLRWQVSSHCLNRARFSLNARGLALSGCAESPHVERRN